MGYETNNIGQNRSQQTNTDFWTNQLEQREKETKEAEQKWKAASSLWNRIWGEMQSSWTSLSFAKNIFHKYDIQKMSFETYKNNLLKEMNWQIKVAEDNAREKALLEGKTPEEAEEIAKTAGEDVKSNYSKKILNNSFDYENFMPSYKEKMALRDNAQSDYGNLYSKEIWASSDSRDAGRAFVDASNMELKAKQNLTIAEYYNGSNFEAMG